MRSLTMYCTLPSVPTTLVAVAATNAIHHPEPIVQRKMTVLWLKQQGLPHHEIAPPGRAFPGLPLPAISKSSPKAA